MEPGTPGYAELLEVLADPGREDHDHFRSWVEQNDASWRTNDEQRAPIAGVLC